MPDFSFSIASIKITPFFWGLALASLISSFSFWRQLKEDFQEEKVFSLTLLIFAFSLFFSRLFYLVSHLQILNSSPVSWFFPQDFGFSLAGAFLGAVLAVNWRASKWEKNAWEVLDALVLPFFYFLILGGTGYFLTKGNWWSLAYVGLGLLGRLSYPWLKGSYRSFAWYKSGKTGFLISIYGFGLFFSFFSLAILKKGGLYLDNWLGLFLASVFLIALYYRSERNLREDSQVLFQKITNFRIEINRREKWPK